MKKFTLTKLGRALLLAALVVEVMLCESCTVDSRYYSESAYAEKTQTRREHNITGGTEGWTMRQCQEFCVKQYGQNAVHEPFRSDERLKHHGNCGWCVEK